MRQISCILMRGGTSKGPFFRTGDLPAEPALRDAALLDIMGSGNELEIDGIGGGHPLSSKVAMVDRSEAEGVDVDYLFAQVGVMERVVDTGPNCGNMLVAVAPFAIETGLVEATHPETLVRVRNVNTDTLVDCVVQTPGGRVEYAGDVAIDGVPGRSAPVKIIFKTGAGSKTGHLFPTGHESELIDGIEVTLIDMSVPAMILDARALGKTGGETPAELDADRAFMQRLEALRLEAGRRMGLGDVSNSVLPKTILVAPPRSGGTLTARYFMPHACHRAFAATGAVCLTAAGLRSGTVAGRVAQWSSTGQVRRCTIEHPAGNMDIEVDVDVDKYVRRASLIRTARKLFSGTVYVAE